MVMVRSIHNSLIQFNHLTSPACPPHSMALPRVFFDLATAAATDDDGGGGEHEHKHEHEQLGR